MPSNLEALRDGSAEAPMMGIGLAEDREGGHMATERLVIPGVIKNGLVVPQGDATLPEGAHVEIVIPALEVTPELRAEFDAWERAGDEAWAQIDQWEREERS
jgi:hypothetical protein